MVDVRINRGALADIERLVTAELTRMAIRVENAAKRQCPVDTGRLRSSITHEVRDGSGDVIAVARVGTNVEYGPYVELGTSRASAQPFLRPALQAAKR